MPVRRRYNYRRKRRYNNRRRRRIRNSKYARVSTKVNNVTTGIPDRTFLKMKYSEVILVDASALGQYNVFRGNSIHDPNYFIGGGSATSIAEWSLFYERYRVHASKMKVEVLNINTTAQNSTVLVALVPSNEPNLSSIPVEDVNTLPYCKYTTISAASGGPMPAKLTAFMSTKKMYGLNNINDEDYASTIASTPYKQWYWDLSYANLAGSGASNTVTLRVLVTITYYVELYKRTSKLTVVNNVVENGETETGDNGPQGPIIPFPSQ